MIEYDYEKDRDKAFIICNNKIFYGDVHFDCYIRALEYIYGEDEISYNYDKYFNMNDSEIEKTLGDIIKGEIATVDNIKSTLVYAMGELETIKKFVNTNNFYYCERCGNISPIC